MEAGPLASFRCSPDDFVVEEIPAYAPSGSGEHLFITFTKREVTTLDAVNRLAAALNVDTRAAGFAGMKDRNAVTTQTASFPMPLARDPEAALAAIALPGIKVLSVGRHGNKLKPGHLIGNRFTIMLRDLDAAEGASVVARLEEVGRIGVPNAFGPQRFGRDGTNPDRALAWIAGRIRGPRDRREQRLIFSSLQSLVFNRVLEARVAAGNWAHVLPGDVAKKHETGGLFTVPSEGPELEDARARAEAGSVSATGPIFGAKMRAPEGEPAAIEREVFARTFPDAPDLEALRHLGEGTRRTLRLLVEGMTAFLVEDPTRGVAGSSKVAVAVRFVLPKGGYATTVLSRACRLLDASSPPGRPIDPGSMNPAVSFDDARDDLQEA